MTCFSEIINGLFLYTVHPHTLFDIQKYIVQWHIKTKKSPAFKCHICMSWAHINSSLIIGTIMYTGFLSVSIRSFEDLIIWEISHSHTSDLVKFKKHLARAENLLTIQSEVCCGVAVSWFLRRLWKPGDICPKNIELQHAKTLSLKDRSYEKTVISKLLLCT